MRNNPVCWFELYVQDMARARSFYEGVFDVKLERMNSPGIEMWAFAWQADKGGAGGALVYVPEVASGGNSTLVYFECDDCAVEESRVRTFGGQIHRAKLPIGEHGFISLVIDTEGNMVGLYSQP